MLTEVPYAVRSNIHFPGITLMRHAVRDESESSASEIAASSYYAVRRHSGTYGASTRAPPCLIISNTSPLQNLHQFGHVNAIHFGPGLNSLTFEV